MVRIAVAEKTCLFLILVSIYIYVYIDIERVPEKGRSVGPQAGFLTQQGSIKAL